MQDTGLLASSRANTDPAEAITHTHNLSHASFASCTSLNHMWYELAKQDASLCSLSMSQTSKYSSSNNIAHCGLALLLHFLHNLLDADSCLLGQLLRTYSQLGRHLLDSTGDLCDELQPCGEILVLGQLLVWDDIPLVAHDTAPGRLESHRPIFKLLKHLGNPLLAIELLVDLDPSFDGSPQVCVLLHKDPHTLALNSLGTLGPLRTLSCLSHQSIPQAADND